MNALDESNKYAALNPRKGKRKRYPWPVHDAVVARIPPSILEAMNRVGWNVEGVYEVFAEELRRHKREQKKANNGT